MCNKFKCFYRISNTAHTTAIDEKLRSVFSYTTAISTKFTEDMRNHKCLYKAKNTVTRAYRHVAKPRSNKEYSCTFN